jgi:hypothetical protein
MFCSLLEDNLELQINLIAFGLSATSLGALCVPKASLREMMNYKNYCIFLKYDFYHYICALRILI